MYYYECIYTSQPSRWWKTRLENTCQGAKDTEWVEAQIGSRSSWPYWRSGEGGRIELGLWWLWLIDSYTDVQIRDQVSFLFTAPGSLLSPYWKPCYSPGNGLCFQTPGQHTRPVLIAFICLSGQTFGPFLIGFALSTDLSPTPNILMTGDR